MLCKLHFHGVVTWPTVVSSIANDSPVAWSSDKKNQKWHLHRVKTCQIDVSRDVGSISNLGEGTTLLEHILLGKKGHFLRMKRALLSLL